MAASKKKGEPPNKTKSVATRGYPKGHPKNPYQIVGSKTAIEKWANAQKKSPQGRANAKKKQGVKTELRQVKSKKK